MPSEEYQGMCPLPVHTIATASFSTPPTGYAGMSVYPTIISLQSVTQRFAPRSSWIRIIFLGPALSGGNESMLHALGRSGVMSSVSCVLGGGIAHPLVELRI